MKRKGKMFPGSAPIEKVREVLEPLLRYEGLKLWDLEYQREGKGMVLRVYVDKEGGANVEDLSRVSRQLGDLLEVKEAIEGKYTLEVSTPGVNRKLTTLEHFRSFQGKRIRLKCLHLTGGRRVFHGILEDVVDGCVKIRDETGTDWTIPIRDIAKANYEHVFAW
jgi:ribosome maturation factor RimP